MAHPTGLAIPVGITSAGRARLSTGDEQLVKIIGTHLSNADSENPFQQIGISGIVFGINDKRVQPLIRHRLGTLFGRLKAEGRAELDEGSIRFENIPDEGELELFFKYLNLRTNETEDFRGFVDRASGRVIPS